MKQPDATTTAEPVTAEASSPPSPLVMTPQMEEECRRYAGPDGGVFKAGPVYAVELLRELDETRARLQALQGGNNPVSTKTFYDFGLEQASDVNGWALFSGAEGDSPDFRGFITDEEAARVVALIRDPNDPEEPFYFDPAVVRAVLTADMGVVAENEVLDTYEALRERIQQARAAGMVGEIQSRLRTTEPVERKLPMETSDSTTDVAPAFVQCDATLEHPELGKQYCYVVKGHASMHHSAGGLCWPSETPGAGGNDRT